MRRHRGALELSFERAPLLQFPWASSDEGLVTVNSCFRAVLFTCGLALSFASGAQAQDPQEEPWLLSLGADAAVPVTDSQRAQYLPGAQLSVGVLRPIDPTFAFGARIFGGLLFDGPAPQDTLRADPGIGSWVGITVGLRIRPQLGGEGPDRAAGLSLTLEAGAVLTGSVVRPALGAIVGYGIDVGPVVIEPRVSVLHIVHFDDPLDDGQGVMVLGGMAFVVGETHREPATLLAEDVGAPSDRDLDGIMDQDDGCPDVPEDDDGIDDEDGCPETDVDGDGVLDEDDLCLRDPEDHDGLRDQDGCPEEDADLDGILDPSDRCPEEREIINGVEDEDGCPDEGLVVLEGDRVVLDERVLFDTNQARVRHRALPVLRAVANLFLTHPEWQRMRIEGHADERGDEEFNRELSERRAARVAQVLREFGVSDAQMAVVGYGEERPRVEGALDANRRVEFVMVGGGS